MSRSCLPFLKDSPELSFSLAGVWPPWTQGPQTGPHDVLGSSEGQSRAVPDSPSLPRVHVCFLRQFQIKMAPQEWRPEWVSSFQVTLRILGTPLADGAYTGLAPHGSHLSPPTS